MRLLFDLLVFFGYEKMLLYRYRIRLDSLCRCLIFLFV